jgi:hypothetical protein
MPTPFREEELLYSFLWRNWAEAACVFVGFILMAFQLLNRIRKAQVAE